MRIGRLLRPLRPHKAWVGASVLVIVLLALFIGFSFLVFVALVILLSALLTRWLAPPLVRLLNLPALRAHRDEGDAFILLAPEAEKRETFTHVDLVAVSLMLAGASLVISTAMANAGMTPGAVGNTLDRASGTLLYALLVMPLAALAWTALWIPEHSHIRTLRRNPGVADRLVAWWPLRLAGPGLLFSALAVLARQIEQDETLGGAVMGIIFQVTGVVILLPVSILIALLFATLNLPRAYAKLDVALNVQKWPDMATALAGNGIHPTTSAPQPQDAPAPSVGETVEPAAGPRA